MLTVVIPTQGRKTLCYALGSLKPENQNGHQCDILVVVDTHGEMLDSKEHIKELCTNFGARYAEHDAGYNDFGYPQLEVAYQSSQNEEFICNIGDDDIFVPNILERIEYIIERGGIHPYLFQAMLHPSPNRGLAIDDEPVLLWNDEDRSIERKKITGQNLIVPTWPEFMGHWVDDFEFMRQTIEKWENRVTWVPVCIVQCY